VRTKIAVVLSLVLLFSNALLADGVDVRADFDEAQGDASPISDAAISVRSNHSELVRNRQLRRELSVTLVSDFHARLKNSLAANGIKAPSLFVWPPQRALFKLQRVYRI
jgi:hypothetical protein